MIILQASSLLSVDTMYKYVINLHCAECPADFTHIPPVNGCYKLVNRNLEWSVAGLECRSLHKDAHLLVINDAVEQLAVAGMLASTNRQCLFHSLHFVENDEVLHLVEFTVGLVFLS